MIRCIPMGLVLGAAAAACCIACAQEPLDAFSQGQYVGPPRLAHVPEYRLRVDDQLQFTYQLSREPLAHAYPLEVGDVIRVESIVDSNLNRELTVQPDGTVDLLLLGPVSIARRSIEEVRRDLNEQYKKYYKVADVHVTRVRTQSRLNELRQAAERQLANGESGGRVRVSPAGMISLPAIGEVPAQGLTLDELRREISARYRDIVHGLEVTPILAQRAARHVYIAGAVRHPGRYELTGPTTVMQSIALAGGWGPASDLRQIVVFRRTDDWRLVATKLDLTVGPVPACPWADELWLCDSDLVVVPTGKLGACDHLWKHLFSRGHGCEPIAEATLIDTSGPWGK